MVTLTLYKIYKDFRALDDNRETEAIEAWSKEDLYEEVIRNWFTMNQEELSSVPDNLIKIKVETYPERDISNFDKDMCIINRNTCLFGCNLYTYSLSNRKWMKKDI